MTTVTVVKHPCARCQKRQPADRMVYSRHTRSRYCADFAACDRRAHRTIRVSDRDALTNANQHDIQREMKW